MTQLEWYRTYLFEMMWFGYKNKNSAFCGIPFSRIPWRWKNALAVRAQLLQFISAIAFYVLNDENCVVIRIVSYAGCTNQSEWAQKSYFLVLLSTIWMTNLFRLLASLNTHQQWDFIPRILYSHFQIDLPLHLVLHNAPSQLSLVVDGSTLFTTTRKLISLHRKWDKMWLYLTECVRYSKWCDQHCHLIRIFICVARARPIQST